MLEGANIRYARPSDATSIGEVYAETWQDTYPAALPINKLARLSKDALARQWFVRIKSAQGAYRTSDAVIVATTAQGRIVAFGDCGVNRRPQYRFASEVYTLYVLPDYQQFGLGTRILGALFDHLRNYKKNTVVVWALIDNPNRHFYSGLGGEIIGEYKTTHWGSAVTEVGYGWHNLKEWLSENDEALRIKR